MLNEFRSTSITWDKATRRIYSPITANESDSNGRKLNIQVVNSGQVENLTGATLHLYWETKDKTQHGLDAFTASDISKGEFEIFYTTGMLSNVGELNATLVLVDSTGKVVSDWFKITVTRGINEGAIQSENSFSSLTQALIDISNLEQNYTPRLNDLTAQLQQTEQQVNGMILNVKYTPVGVEPLLGNGTDETDKIQAIFDYCNVNNIKKVLFPKGTYLFNGTVNIEAWDMEIEGVGIRATNFKKINSGYMFNVNLSNGPGGWRRVTFKNISIFGDSNKIGSGIALKSVQLGLFENCDFTHLDKAVTLTGDSHYNKFMQCIFNSCSTPIFNPTATDPDWFAGESNNNIIDHCFFTYCTNPILQGEGSGWTVSNTDFEGYNGTIEIKSNNSFNNVRIERNLYDKIWLQVNGDGNTLDFGLYGMGAPKQEWRVKVYGKFNQLNARVGFVTRSILDLGGSNKFNVMMHPLNIVYANDPVLYMIRKDSSFIINNVETMYKSRAKDYSNNFLTARGGSSGIGTDTMKEEVSGKDEFILSIPASYTYAIANIDRTKPRWVNFAVDIFIEDTIERETTEDFVHVSGAGVSQYSGFKTKTWYRAIQMVFADSTGDIIARVIKNKDMGSKRVVFANAQLSVDVPPADLPYNTLTLTKSIS